MKLDEWKKTLEGLNADVTACENALWGAQKKRDDFLTKTVGVAPGEVATVHATVDMIARVVAMVTE